MRPDSVDRAGRSCVVPCTRTSATVAVHSANCSLKSRSSRNRRPARKLRLKYFTPDSTFPFVWARYARHSRGSKPQKSANALNVVFH